MEKSSKKLESWGKNFGGEIRPLTWFSECPRYNIYIYSIYLIRVGQVFSFVLSIKTLFLLRGSWNFLGAESGSWWLFVESFDPNNPCWVWILEPFTRNGPILTIFSQISKIPIPALPVFLELLTPIRSCSEGQKEMLWALKIIWIPQFYRICT